MKTAPAAGRLGEELRQLWPLVLLLSALTGTALPAVPAETPQQLLEQLDAVSIDRARIYAVRDARITRDRVNIYLNRGFLGFVSDVAGEITGAVFEGSGEVLLVPPNTVEKANLAQFTKSPVLEEPFTSGYLRFTDRTAQELLHDVREAGPDDLDQPGNFADRWNPTIRRLNSDHSARILQDLIGDRSRPYFHARLQGVNLGVFSVTEDERLPEAVSVGASRQSHGGIYADLWCSFPSRASEARGGEWPPTSARVTAYQIETRISTDRSLSGRAELQLESRSSADRVLIFELSRWLRVSEVNDDQAQKLVVFQNPALEESEVAVRGNDRVMVVLATPHPAGEKYRVRFSYQGNVIADAGNGVLYVGARGSWYPNLGRGLRAKYDLTFDYPQSLTLIATGSRVIETTSNGEKHSRWISDGAFPVAGFNLGPYRSHVRRVGKTAIEVYATPEAEALLEKRHAAAESSALVPPAPPPTLSMRPFGRRSLPVDPMPKAVPPLAPSALLEEVTDSAARAVNYFETLFGPIPYPRLAISQIPGNFGQGWPELVYLPTLSFLPSSQRLELGVSGKADDALVAHEVAHQWWGNLLGWKTYHDQWLAEGLASYSAALYLAREKDGQRKFHELLRGYRSDLLSKTPEGKTVESGGAIWLGVRLSNSLDPRGYGSIVYKKACWVFRMLHVLMTDPTTRSDGPFFKMLRDFITAYHDHDPSTQDFVQHAAKYITRPLGLERNHELDWFFNEWVYGTGIPNYKLQASTRQLGAGKFVVEGTIEQSGVSPEFEMPVPVAAVYGKDKRVLLGRVAVGETSGRFRFTIASKPARVVIDDDSVLAAVR